MKSISEQATEIANLAEVRAARTNWKEDLVTNRNGEYSGNELNAITALEQAPQLQGLVAYNEFSDEVTIMQPAPWRNIKDPEPWSDVDRIELQAWLQAQEISVNRANVVQDAVITVARRKTYNPVTEYLDGLEWDHTFRLAHWLDEYMGAIGEPRYLDAIGPKILVGAVARAYEPGCKLDVVPVLEGPQGKGKSTAVRILGHPWNADGVPDLSTKDAAIQIQGVWLVELEELTSMSRADVEHVKAFLSRSTDRYRPPYGRNAVNRPRRCAFIASTNLQDYLKDETGNRRFWPIRCRGIDLAALQRDKDQLWAEAVHEYRNGLQWHLSASDEVLAAQEQELRRLVPELEAELIEYLEDQRSMGKDVVYMRELLKDVAGIRDFAKDRYHAGAIASQFSRVMTRQGWEKMKAIGRGENRRQPYQWQGGNS